MSSIAKRVETRGESKTANGSTGIITTWLGEGLRWALLFPALRLFVRVKVYGTENLQGEGPYILAANHASHLDAPLLLASLPLRLRLQVRVVAAADYFFSQRWKGALVRVVFNAFSFERKGAGSMSSLAQAQRLLCAGHSLLLFPEGTRTQNGQLQPFKWGVGKLALARSASVIPIWIDGTYAALPKGARWPHPQKIAIWFGAPMQFAPTSSPLSIAAEIERQVRALASADQARRNERTKV